MLFDKKSNEAESFVLNINARVELMRQYRVIFNKMKAVIGSLFFVSIAVSPAVAEDLTQGSVTGVYRGFLAFDFKGKEVREWMMISFSHDGTMVFGAEEGHDEPVDPATKIVTKNDFESASLGLWRVAGGKVEFGTQQYRAGSAFCGPVNKHPDGLLATCSFILTGRLAADAAVRGEKCDLGGLNGGLAVQSVDGEKTESNPLNLGLKIDYCLNKQSIDTYMKLAPPG